MKEEIGYFDVLKSVITKIKVDNDDVEKHFVPFISMKWLSVDPKTCYTINQLNSAQGLNHIPKMDEYLFLKRVVNLPKNKYIAFDKNDKEMDIIIHNIAMYYRCGKETAKEYMKILGSDRIIELLEKIAQVNNKFTTDKNILDLRNAINKKRKEIQKYKGIK